MRHRYNALDNGRVRRVTNDVDNEGTIDLYLINGQVLQVIQTRVAGSKIVDRRFDTHVTELLQFQDGVISTINEYPFSDFDLKELGRQSRSLQTLPDTLNEIDSLKVRWGNVHDDRERGKPLLAQATAVTTCRGKHPLSQRNYLPGLLSGRNKLRR